MNKSFIILSLLSGMVTAFGQQQKNERRVGINTENPNATLEVAGVPSNPNVLDGIIAPRIGGNQLTSKIYTTNQTGALVYVTTTPTTTNSQTKEVTDAGYYYFNGTIWKALKGNSTTGSTPTQYQAGKGMILNNNTFSRTGLEQYDNNGFGFVGTVYPTGIVTGNSSLDMNLLISAPRSQDVEYEAPLGDHSMVIGNSNYTAKEAVGAIAIGSSNEARGAGSITMGFSNLTMGQGSVAIGNKIEANGAYSMAIGDQTKTGINGAYAFAGGRDSEANGAYSFSYGYRTTTNNSIETALGTYNFSTDTTPLPRAGTFSSTNHQLFSIGNGRSSASRSNAIVVLRNANTGIGIPNSKPTEMLDVNGNIRVRGGSATEGGNCTNNGTITYHDGNFFGCGNNVWKKLNL